MKPKRKKIIQLLAVEIVIFFIALLVGAFKYTTNNIFFPNTFIIFIIWLFVAAYIGIGIWYDKV